MTPPSRRGPSSTQTMCDSVRPSAARLVSHRRLSTLADALSERVYKGDGAPNTPSAAFRRKAPSTSWRPNVSRPRGGQGTLPRLRPCAHGAFEERPFFRTGYGRALDRPSAAEEDACMRSMARRVDGRGGEASAAGAQQEHEKTELCSRNDPWRGQDNI